MYSEVYISWNDLSRRQSDDVRPLLKNTGMAIYCFPIKTQSLELECKAFPGPLPSLLPDSSGISHVVLEFLKGIEPKK